MKLNCVRLSKKYGSNVALKDFSHEFVPGVYGLLGPNGAGKTTLMNIMTDNLRQTTGTLLYEGTDIHKLGREYRRHIGYVPQQQQVFPGFTLRRFLLYISGLKGLNSKEAVRQITDIVRKVFDVEKFRNECSRILKKDGRAVLIWNIRDESDPLNRELHRVFSKYCPDFKGFGGGIVKDDPRIRTFFDDKYDYISFDNPLYYDKEKYIARNLSGSYSLKEGDQNYDPYMEELVNSFNEYSQNGIVSIANRSVAYIGKVTKY